MAFGAVKVRYHQGVVVGHTRWLDKGGVVMDIHKNWHLTTVKVPIFLPPAPSVPATFPNPGLPPLGEGEGGL